MTTNTNTIALLLRVRESQVFYIVNSTSPLLIPKEIAIITSYRASSLVLFDQEIYEYFVVHS